MAEAKFDEGKEGEGKDNGDAKSGPDIFDAVAQFCMSSGFEKDFEDFAEAHFDLFESAVDLKLGDEHSLEYHKVYQEYLAIFESKVERFVVEQGSDIKEFQKLAEAALQNRDTPPDRAFFIEALLATTEYDCFLGLMKNEVRRLKATGKFPGRK